MLLQRRAGWRRQPSQGDAGVDVVRLLGDGYEVIQIKSHTTTLNRKQQTRVAEGLRQVINDPEKHVGILEEVDLVVTAKVGRARVCQLGLAQLEAATEWIDEYRRTWQRRLDRFGTYVERKDAGR
jgi:hypothetical protein